MEHPGAEPAQEQQHEDGLPEAVGGWFQSTLQGAFGHMRHVTGQMARDERRMAERQARRAAGDTRSPLRDPMTQIEAAGRMANFYQNNVAVVPQVWRHWKEAVQPCEGAEEPSVEVFGSYLDLAS